MGLIHLYCGDGKGKTTAALGLAIRAAGSGMSVHLVQFLKGRATSELNILSRIPNISVSRCDRNYGFFAHLTPAEKDSLIACHNRLLNEAMEMMNTGEIDMLILDEFNAAYKYEAFDRQLAEQVIFEKPKAVELVLTGRNPDEKFIAAANYVSEIHALKHPYEQGHSARIGIEY